MQFMLIRTDNDTRTAATDAHAVLDDLLRRLPGAHPGTAPAGSAVEGVPRAPALALAFAPDAEAVRLKLWPGGEAVTSGPFPAAERLPAGFAVLEAPSRAAAVGGLQDQGLARAGESVTRRVFPCEIPAGSAHGADPTVATGRRGIVIPRAQ